MTDKEELQWFSKLMLGTAVVVFIFVVTVYKISKPSDFQVCIEKDFPIEQCIKLRKD